MFDVYIVRPNIYGYLNENMQQAKSVLRKSGIEETHPDFVRLREILTTDNKLGLIGKFTKWIFKDGESLQKILDTYDLLKKYPKKIPPIDTFKTVEDLYDHLTHGEADTKLNQVIKSMPSKTRENVTPELKELISANIKHADELIDFYSKAGGRYNKYSKMYELPREFSDHKEWLYDVTHELIKNLEGDFNLESMKRKIKESPGEAQIVLERPDLLIVTTSDHSMACEIGSSRFCIITSKSMWNSYVNVFNEQYFVYDFTKQKSDKKSMLGATVLPDGSFKDIQYRTNDGTARSDFEEGRMDKEMLSYLRPKPKEEVAKEFERRINKIPSKEIVKDEGWYRVYHIKNGKDIQQVVSRMGGTQDEYYYNFYLLHDKEADGYNQVLGIKVTPEDEWEIMNASGNKVDRSHLEKY